MHVIPFFYSGEALYLTPEKPPALKLILKVGGSYPTPEHAGSDSPHQSAMLSQYYQQQLVNYSVTPGEQEYDRYLGHKKLKKKKKKKDKRHKHHHKDKKRKREESSQESVGDGDDSIAEIPKKIHATHQILSSKPILSSNNEIRTLSQPIASSGLSPHREPRTCVLKKIAERTPLQRLLEHLLRSMEKRDPQQFFAWPVTDSIAPGYSQIILNPMDFSTIKQKIDDNNYQTLNDFVEDFKLMCDNAMTYNHPDTIYYKAAKKLLHVGLKMTIPDKLKQLRSVLVYMQDLTKDELGFELGIEDPDVHITEEQIEKEREQEEQIEEAEELRKENQRKMRLANLTKFEAIPDDLTPDEILKQARGAAKSAAEKLSLKRVSSKMGFLRQKKDGTTSLQIIVPGDGVIPGTNQRPVSLGQLIGKLSHGTGALAGFREDRRNLSKPVKPLYYGAFGSYAPSYDSTFSNLTKEESDIVYQTYGDETAVQYAESILDFAKDCDYTLTMVDDLLDILTNGEHRKTKKVLEEKRRLREEEEKIKHLLEKPTQDVNRNIPQVEKVKVDLDQLKTLSEIGIDINFLENLEEELKASDERSTLQSNLEETSNMLNNLRQTQHERLSAPPPQHLANIQKPSESEVILADKITENLTNIAKKLPPSAIAPVDGLRKAMGIAGPLGGPEPMEVEPITHNPSIVTENSIIQENSSNQEANNMMPMSMSLDMNSVRQGQLPMQIVLGQSQTSSMLSTTEASGVNDLESELREFLESDPTLGHSPLHDDKTLEDILSES
ncbi:bromodomain-containing protein 7 isoform X2 [Phymastichus coffea]|uniref:bromodomain-containing protein 7 isoform X2 n=1 Tax=Phymastichus coffea TaxID=108790 RepID=UPI00273A8D3B|nr:bromodomain-containing protein 7 isoform X2 [Phymastichus coffea]XP_058799675.1 bromodomain-containing protein 7 isoform X2 [Phymastichus coffea]